MCVGATYCRKRCVQDGNIDIECPMLENIADKRVVTYNLFTRSRARYGLKDN